MAVKDGGNEPPSRASGQIPAAQNKIHNLLDTPCRVFCLFSKDQLILGGFSQ